MSSESKFYRKLKKLWKGGFIERIENSLGTGIPDIHFIDEHSNSCFLELKVVNKFKHKVLPIRDTQWIWHKRYVNNSDKNRSFILFETDNTYYLFSSRDMIKYLEGKVKWDTFADNATVKERELKKIISYLRIVSFIY